MSKGRLVTTSAVRDARNGDVFRQAALAATGLPAELLSGEDEGQLAYAGATAGLPPIDGDDLVVDIGGGSTELVVRRHGVVQAFSMNIGCVRLSERFLTHDPPEEAEIAALVAFVDGAIDRRRPGPARPLDPAGRSTRGRGRDRHHPGRAVAGSAGLRQRPDPSQCPGQGGGG